METGFPLVMVIGPVVAAAVAVVFRRWRRATAVVGLVSVALLSLLLWLALPGDGLFGDNTVNFYGREVVLTPFVRSLFLFIYSAFGLLAAVSWFRPLGRMVIPSGLAALAPLAAALMVSPAGFGAVWLVVAAAVLVPVVYDGRYEAATASWRYFLMSVLSLMPILLTTSPPIGAWAAPWIGPLLAVLIILGGFPFHIWVSGVGRQSSPAAWVLVFGLAQIVPVVFVLNLLNGAPAGRAFVEFQTAVRWSAAMTALLAAFQMSRSKDWRGFAAGAMLFDMGFLLPAALAPGADSLTIALPALISRFLSLLLITLGLRRPSMIGGSSSSFFQRLNRGLQPALLVYGLLSLIGLPLTPGFAARWAQVAIVGQVAGFWPPALLVTALLLAILAVVRGLNRLGGIGDESGSIYSNGEAILAGVLLALAVLLGAFPDILFNYTSRMLGIL